MRLDFYLIVSESGSIEVRKGRPRLRRDQLAVQLKVVLPDSAFQAWMPVAQIVVPEPALITPEVSVLFPVEEGEA